LQSSITKSVVVTAPNTAPTAVIGTPTCVNRACDFSGSGSSDPEGTNLTYSWNFGDSSSGSNTATGVTASHSFTTAGTYTVTLTVSDGSLTGTVTKSVTVTDTAYINDIDATGSDGSGNKWTLNSITFHVRSGALTNLSGVTISMVDLAGTTRTCTSDSNGNCTMTGITDLFNNSNTTNNYTISVTMPTNYTYTSGSNTNTDGDTVTVSGNTVTIENPR
jgi:large repetitive protein